MLTAHQERAYNNKNKYFEHLIFNNNNKNKYFEHLIFNNT